MGGDPLVRLRDRILRFTAAQDDRVILDPEALEDAREALADVRRGLRDASFDAVVSASPLWIIGTFHVFRYTLLPEDECLEALQEAAEGCLPLYLRDPELVPVPVRPVIEEWVGRAGGRDLIDHLGDEAVRRLRLSGARHDFEGVDRAVRALRAVVAAVPESDPRRSWFLRRMVLALGERYQATGDMTSLDMALELVGEAERTSDDGTRYFTAAIKYELLVDRHRADGAGDGIADVIAGASQDLLHMSQSDPHRVDMLFALSNAHEARFAIVGDPRHLDGAIAAVREAGKLSDDARRPTLAVRLGDLVIASDRDLSRVAESASFIAPTSPQRVDVLWHLALECQQRYEQTNRLDYLDATIACVERSLDPAIEHHPGRGAFHAALAVVLTNRFDHVGNIDDLNGSIAHGYQAMGTPVHNVSVRPSMLQTLAGSLRRRAETRHSAEDLDESVAISRLALDEADRLGGSRALILAELAAAASVRYDLRGDVSDLETACELGYAALDEAAEQAHPSLPAVLSNLSNALRARYTATGERQHLDEAIAISRQAVDASRPGSVARVLCLHNLATALRNRYELRFAVDDLNEAIARWREADRDGPVDNVHRGHVLEGLAGGLLLRHGRSKNPTSSPGVDDLNDAIDCVQRAVESPVIDVASHAGALSVLAVMHHRRHRLDGNPSDLEAAIAMSSEAVYEVPPVSPSKGSIVLNHIDILHTGDAQQLETAIELSQTLAEELADDDPRRAMCLDALAQCQYQRFARERRSGDLDAAIVAWRTAARIASAPAHIRAEAARSWGAALALRGTDDVWIEALEAFTLAVELLPLIVWRGMDRTSQEEMLDPHTMVACDAAACAIAAGSPQAAVELLEHGRTVLWSQWLGIRDALAELRDTAPDLAQRLISCRGQLDRPVDTTALTGDLLLGITLPAEPDWGADQRERAARVWEETLAEVRRLPGYELFLLPPSFDRLRSAGSRGPVCIINVSAIRIDVLVVSQNGVRVIPLPDVTYEDIVQHVARHISALHYGEGPDAGPCEAVSATLAWLWESIVGPTLRALDAGGERIWWCPTGPLSLLPIHAAAYREADSVIPSYTPSLSMLIQARRPRDSTANAARLLVVGMPDPPIYTAGLGPLPGVVREVQAITDRLDGNCHILLGEQASRGETLRQLPSYSWAHFACHGRQDLERPTLGALYLHDAPLRINEISALDLRNAELAYLSACDTGTGGVVLFNEAINVATAFHYAGYQHVVATLWQIRDSTAAEVAAQVYHGLTASGALDSTEAATVLHDAVRDLARRYPDNPLAWAPYMHIGP